MMPAKDVPWEVELIWQRNKSAPLEVTIRCRGTMTTVLLYRTYSRLTPLDILIDLYDHTAPGSLEFEDTVIDSLFQSKGSEALHTIFSSAQGRADDLYSFLYPVTYRFSLSNIPDGGFRLSPLPLDDEDDAELWELDCHIRKPCPTPPRGEDSSDWDAIEDDFENEASFRPPRVELSVTDEERASIPRYSAAEITFADDYLSYGYHVTVDGRDARVKLLGRHGHLQREFECLRKISHSQYADTIRTTKLLGFVVDPESDMETGLLEDYVPSPCGCCEHLGEVFRNHGVTRIQEARRKIWADQLRETVDQLHEIGLVWGDPALENAMVHPGSDEAFIIHFDGESRRWTGTEWKEVARTVESDEQGLQNVMRRMGLLDARAPVPGSVTSSTR
jgi:hypothetical protein